MGVASLLAKKKASRVIGLDLSTKSLAFAIFDDERPVRCGEVLFKGSTVFDRLKDARKKVRALVESGEFEADYIAIEAAIMVRNIQTAIDLAYVYGTILGELSDAAPVLEKVAPITWQSAIGNPNLKKAEKEQIQKDFPNKSKSWYQSKGREIRKGRTLDIAREYFEIADGSDNVGDAVGIALYVSRVLTRR